MKILPPSWTKEKKNSKQLSFEDTLFSKPVAEDLFIESLLNTLRNAKFLRYRLAYSNCKKLEKIAAYEHWSDILETSVTILYDVSRKSPKFRHKTFDDYLHDIFISKIDYAPTEVIPRSELLRHHDNVCASITGMFLAYEKLLKKNRREVKKIAELLKASNINIHRLE